VAVADPMQQAQPLPRLASNPASIESRALVGQLGDGERERASIVADGRDTLLRSHLDNLDPVGGQKRASG
jgi:hypothetical protein